MSAKLGTVALAAAALVLAAAAQAKAPPGGIDVCGADGGCVHVTMAQAETEWALWSPPSLSESVRPSAVAPFLVVHWLTAEQATQTAYYVPSTGSVRHDADGVHVWFPLTDAVAVRTLTANLQTYPAPAFTSVTVGGRPANDPQSYARLFSVGSPWLPLQYPSFIRIRLTTAAWSPWTGEDVRISRTGRLLWLDGETFRIPLQLARRIRARRSLGPS